MIDLRSLTSADFLAALLDLLPVGWAWPRDPDSVQGRTLAGAADGLARHHGRAVDLLDRESLPPASLELLGDWERVLGLPDPCAPAGATVEERRAAVAEKLARRGGQTRAFFVGVAERLGYAVEIDEFRPFVAGLSRCGDALGGPGAVRHVWRVRVADPVTIPFRAGASRAGDRLLTIRRAEALECILQRLRPAHTTLVFDYQGA